MFQSVPICFNDILNNRKQPWAGIGTGRCKEIQNEPCSDWSTLSNSWSLSLQDHLLFFSCDLCSWGSLKKSTFPGFLCKHSKRKNIRCEELENIGKHHSVNIMSHIATMPRKWEPLVQNVPAARWPLIEVAIADLEVELLPPGRWWNMQYIGYWFHPRALKFPKSLDHCEKWTSLEGSHSPTFSTPTW